MGRPRALITLVAEINNRIIRGHGMYPALWGGGTIKSAFVHEMTCLE